MNKFIGGIILLSSITLVACSNEIDNTGKETTKDTSASVSSSSTEPIDESHVEKGKLLKVGQWTEDESYGGKVTLIKLASPKQTVQVSDDFSMLINDVKILEYSEVDKAILDSDVSDGFIPESALTDDGFYSIQIDYIINNNTETALDYNGLEYIVTDQGQQIDVLMDNLNYSNSYTFQPGTEVDNYVIATINAETIDELKKITLTTSELWNENYDTTLGSEESIEINFN